MVIFSRAKIMDWLIYNKASRIQNSETRESHNLIIFTAVDLFNKYLAKKQMIDINEEEKLNKILYIGITCYFLSSKLLFSHRHDGLKFLINEYFEFFSNDECQIDK